MLGLGGAWGLSSRRKSQSLVGWEAYLSGLGAGPGTLYWLRGDGRGRNDHGLCPARGGEQPGSQRPAACPTGEKDAAGGERAGAAPGAY